MAKADVEMLCENLNQTSEQTSLEPAKKKLSASVKKSGYVKKPESMQICAAKEIQPAEPRDEDEETPIESINLLDYIVTLFLKKIILHKFFLNILCNIPAFSEKHTHFSHFPIFPFFSQERGTPKMLRTLTRSRSNPL